MQDQEAVIDAFRALRAVNDPKQTLHNNFFRRAWAIIQILSTQIKPPHSIPDTC
jgi:hypothetical protein